MIAPIRSAGGWSTAGNVPATSEPLTPVPPVQQVSDPVTLTPQAQALLEEEVAAPEEESSVPEAIAELLSPDEADVEPPEPATDRVVEALLLSRLQKEDSQTREGGQIPADAWLQLGPDDRWYAVGGLARDGVTELGPSAHEHGDDCAVCARFAAKFEEVSQLE